MLSGISDSQTKPVFLIFLVSVHHRYLPLNIILEMPQWSEVNKFLKNFSRQNSKSGIREMIIEKTETIEKQRTCCEMREMSGINENELNAKRQNITWLSRYNQCVLKYSTTRFPAVQMFLINII